MEWAGRTLKYKGFPIPHCKTILRCLFRTGAPFHRWFCKANSVSANWVTQCANPNNIHIHFNFLAICPSSEIFCEQAVSECVLLKYEDRINNLLQKKKCSRKYTQVNLGFMKHETFSRLRIQTIKWVSTLTGKLPLKPFQYSLTCWTVKDVLSNLGP